MIEHIIQAALVGTAVAIGTIIFNKVRRLPQIDKYKALAHILTPAAILAASMYAGGWVAIGFDHPAVIGELRTEMKTGAATSTKPGFVFIAEPDEAHSEYVVEITKGPAGVWSSLNEKAASDNRDSHVGLIASGLHVTYPMIDVHEPLAAVVEGELGSHIIVDNRSEPVEGWKLSSRNRLALIVPVLFNCFVALGIGLVTGAPPITPNQKHRRKKRTKPNKN